MIRIALIEGELQVDKARKLPGRGANVCNNQCAELALKRRQFERAFKAAVSTSSENLDFIN